jgi:hypothetical protein
MLTGASSGDEGSKPYGVAVREKEDGLFTCIGVTTVQTAWQCNQLLLTSLKRATHRSDVFMSVVGSMQRLYR